MGEICWKNEWLDVVNKLNRKKCGPKMQVGYIPCVVIIHPVGPKHLWFEICCYDCCDIEKSKNDKLSKDLHDYNNANWVNVFNKTDKELLKILVRNDLDILVDMMGHTRNTRMNALQYKPAENQISYFVYASTNGLNGIAYSFTDKYANTPGTDK